MVGDECAAHRHNLEVQYPVTNGACCAVRREEGVCAHVTDRRPLCCFPAGVVNNWEDMEHVWDHTFYDRLSIDPKECNILLTGAPHRILSTLPFDFP